MYIQEHEKRCIEKLGAPFTLAHLFLDQFADRYERRFGRHNMVCHRHVLHHQQGIALIASLFGSAMGEAARRHVQDDIAPDEPFGRIRIPASWDEYPVHGQQARLIRKQIKRDWQRMAALLDRFTVIITGDTEGGTRKVIKPILQQANLLIIAGKHWDTKNSNQNQKQVLRKFFKYGVVISLQEEQQCRRDMLLRGQRLLFGGEPPSEDSLILRIIPPVAGAKAELEWQDKHLLIRPGYCGSDTRKPLSLVRLDSYGKKHDYLLKVSCLQWSATYAAWIYDQQISNHHPSLHSIPAVRISDLPLEQREPFQQFLRGANMPVLFPDEKKNFAHARDYGAFLRSIQNI